MPQRGSDPFVEQVRAATDIVGVVSAYVELRRAGRRLKGLCPFHGEKTPSFFVHEENQTFYCFGCNVGGDAFQFLMLQEKLTFPEALRMLAERAGIPLPATRGRSAEDSRVGEAIEVAAKFFTGQLSGAEGVAARDYLAARGIEPALIERYALGWAPASWDALIRHARRLLPERFLIQAGLVIEGERGLYDRFRERVMIPIRTAGGRTAAFGGRLLGAGEPKYLNSPETLLYKKGTVLFGLPEAREGIRAASDILVVEGYFDVIALAGGGIDWAVGTCGTALTPEQAGLLRRYSDRWTLLFDGDSAGRAAVLRALDAAVPVHPGVRIALCPAGMDPDSWVRRDGPDAVKKSLERALTPLQYLEEWCLSQGLAPEGTLPRVADLIRKVGDPLIRDHWVQEAAGRFRLSEARLWEAVGRAAPAPRGTRIEPTASLGAPERQIVAAAVGRPDLAKDLLAAASDVPSISARCREVLGWIEQCHDRGAVGGAAVLSLATEDPSLIRDLSFLHEETTMEAEGEGGAGEGAEEILRRLWVKAIRHRHRVLTDRIRRAEERGEAITSLLEEKKRLAGDLRSLEQVEETGGTEG